MVPSVPAETERRKCALPAPADDAGKVAPLVVYLASDAAMASAVRSCRRATMNLLFNQNRPIRTLHRTNGWTPQTLATQLKDAFAASFTPLERSPEHILMGPDLIKEHWLDG